MEVTMRKHAEMQVRSYSGEECTWNVDLDRRVLVIESMSLGKKRRQIIPFESMIHFVEYE
ncbi:MAG: hypothetical protein ACQXXL_08370 [Candidatus Methanosuratincola sp.]